MGRNWTEHELLIAMNLYCRLPFGQCNSRNRLVNEVARRMNRTPGSISRKLGNIASLDPHHQSRGVGGLPHGSKLDRKVWAQFHENWCDMAEKSEAAYQILMGEAFSEKFASSVKQPIGYSEVERTVKTRRMQTFFRNVVLSSYDNRCALTGLAVAQLLIASHIIPWSENEERRADPTNGLCLNVLHDKAFDRHLITFDEGYRLVVSDPLKKRDVSEFQEVNFTKLEGKKITLPHRFAPDPLAFEEHRKAFVT